MGSKSKQTTTQTNTLDPQYSNLVYGAANQAQDLKDSYTPFSGPLTAGFNPTQLQAQQGLLAFAAGDTGQRALNRALDAAGGVAGYQPLNVNARQLQAGQLADTDLSPYMNPFQSQVIDNTLSQYDRQNQIDLNNARGRAASAGAFGGSGSALLQAQMGEANGRTLASTLAGLNSQNFAQAQGAASQDIAGRLAAAQGNQNADLSAQQGNQGAAQNAAALQLQASGALAGLSDQQRAQVLQSLGMISGVGDAQQQQSQAELAAEYQRYVDEMNQRLALQQGVNQGVGLVPQTGTTSGTSITKSSPGLTGILGAAGSLAAGLATGGASLGLTGGLGGILGGGAGAAAAAPLTFYGATGGLSNLYR